MNNKRVANVCRSSVLHCSGCRIYVCCLVGSGRAGAAVVTIRRRCRQLPAEHTSSFKVADQTGSGRTLGGSLRQQCIAASPTPLPRRTRPVLAPAVVGNRKQPISRSRGVDAYTTLQRDCSEERCAAVGPITGKHDVMRITGSA